MLTNCSFDTFLLRTMGYTTARIWAFGYFYDKVNKDPRRMARFDKFLFAGVAGGVVAGLVTNPIDIVFNRMQVDEMYPERARRGYRNFLDGFYKTLEEGAIMRGSLANALKLGLLCSSMAGMFDLCKENSYFFFGPHWINRIWSTVVACLVGTLVSMPFDNIRTRLHTMRPLPNGVLPYNGTLDCLQKVIHLAFYILGFRSSATSATASGALTSSPCSQDLRLTSSASSSSVTCLSSSLTTTTLTTSSRSSGSQLASTTRLVSTTISTTRTPTLSIKSLLLLTWVLVACLLHHPTARRA